MEVNQKMILILTASIMYWSLQQPVEESDSSPSPVAISRGASPEPSFNETPSPVSAAAFSDASSPSASSNGSVSPAPSITPVSFPELNGAPSPSADVSPEPIQAPTLSKEDDSSLSVETTHITMDDADLDKTVPANADETDADVAAVCSPLYPAKADETDADVATVFSPEVEKEAKHAD